MRYIVVGLGNIGTTRRKHLAKRCVATVDPENRDADFRRLEEVDVPYEAAVLAVPDQVKLDLLHTLLGSGKHVLVEKPLMFPNDDAAEQCRSLARTHDVVWYTAYNHRFEPHIVRLKNLIDDQVIGELYHARMVYGNGTAQNVIGSWREDGYGAMAEIGSHLIDLTGFLLGYQDCDYVPLKLQAIECGCYDHCIVATSDRRVFLECSSLMWKNSFSIDIFGRLGSLHVSGLCKWGPSVLTVRTRVFPSGVPIERRETLIQPDPTWKADLKHFEQQVTAGITSHDNDVRISRSIRGIAETWASTTAGGPMAIRR